jgi:hypothetical protein
LLGDFLVFAFRVRPTMGEREGRPIASEHVVDERSLLLREKRLLCPLRRSFPHADYSVSLSDVLSNLFPDGLKF